MQLVTIINFLGLIAILHICKLAWDIKRNNVHNLQAHRVALLIEACACLAVTLLGFTI